MPLSSHERAVLDALARRRDDAIALLTEAVAIPSGTGHAPGIDRMRTLFLGRLERLGADITLIPGEPRPDWLHGQFPGSSPPPTAIARRTPHGAVRRTDRPLLLCGHLDTVHDPRGAFNQLTISADARRATGPGCADMKGGLVIALLALEELHRAGLEPEWTFVLNSDEETGSYHSESAIRGAAREIHERRGLALVMEPALPNGGLVIERPGSGQFMLEARGRAAHVGRDFQNGVSAVNALAERLVEIARWPQRIAPAIISVGPLEGGPTTNSVPESARAWGNVRYTSRENADELRARLLTLATAENEMPSVRVSTSFHRPAKPTTAGTRRLAELACGCARDLDGELSFGATGGVCDGNLIQDEGVPTIDTLGVRGGGLHTTDEWIDLESLTHRLHLLALVMMRAPREETP